MRFNLCFMGEKCEIIFSVKCFVREIIFHDAAHIERCVDEEKVGGWHLVGDM